MDDTISNKEEELYNRLKEINKKIDFDLELKSLESAKEFINKKIESEKNTKK